MVIDLHAHVLPGLDDGPTTLEETGQVVSQALQDGTHSIVAVAHANDHYFDVKTPDYRRAMEGAQAYLKTQQLQVCLIPAMEIRLGPDLVRGLEEGRYLGIGESGYVCVELPAHDFPLYGLDVLYQIRLSGRRVLLIHPERNRSVQKHMELRERLHSMGVLGVASAGSLKGQFGGRAQDAVWELVESGLIQSVSSDGHSVRQRPLGLAWVRELVIRRYGAAAGAWMMDTVPSMVLDGQEVELVPRRRVRRRRWFYMEQNGVL